jgi:hypothetical protein
MFTVRCSTTFLFGPLRQIKNMFAMKRIVATLIYLSALIGTLVVAFTVSAPPASHEISMLPCITVFLWFAGEERCLSDSNDYHSVCGTYLVYPLIHPVRKRSSVQCIQRLLQGLNFKCGHFNRTRAHQHQQIRKRVRLDFRLGQGTCNNQRCTETFLTLLSFL